MVKRRLGKDEIMPAEWLKRQAWKKVEIKQ
jgi:hypothetical protein